jgi:hypothetical protein
MSEYIYSSRGEVLANQHGEISLPRREIVRCRDCKHATLSSLGFSKYCEKFVLPDEDGFGPDPQVNLPLDFFCAYGERRES